MVVSEVTSISSRLRPCMRSISSRTRASSCSTLIRRARSPLAWASSSAIRSSSRSLFLMRASKS